MVEDLGFSRLGAGDQAIVQHVQNILADTFELFLNLLAVFTNGANVLVGAFGFLLLLNGGDNAPGGTT